MPTSRDLWMEWSVHWPISWRPPEPHLSCEVSHVSNTFQQKLEGNMRFALVQAEENGVENCAVVVDPLVEK